MIKKGRLSVLFCCIVRFGEFMHKKVNIYIDNAEFKVYNYINIICLPY